MGTYEETVWFILPGRGAPARRADEKHYELKSFGRFWYQEIRDFLNIKRTVRKKSLSILKISRILTKIW
jgi:hypothetical protein